MKIKYTREEIKRHIIFLKKEEIKKQEEVARTYSKDADLDEESVIELDDLSHQNQSTEAARNMIAQIEEGKQQIVDFEHIHPENSLEVSIGNIVLTNQINLVIGLSFKEFEWNKERFIGISKDAPIFQVLENKKKGDTFEFNGMHYTIEQIL